MTAVRVEEAPDGSPLWQVTLSNGGLRAQILSFGAVLQDLRLAGHGPPLVLGYPTPKPYFDNPNYFGACIGRVANRLRDGRGWIDGGCHQFARNTAQGHLLHGGTQGTAFQNWSLTDVAPDAVVLSVQLPDGHMGFPGTLQACCTYRLRADTTLELTFEATTDRPTLCNFAHHSYFNLNGAATMDGHQLQVAADTYLPTDHDGLPTGHVADVAGTAFDYRSARTLGRLDHNFCLAEGQSLRRAACLRGPDLSMTVATTAPGLQVYTGEGIAPGGPLGLDGRAYAPRAGVALEPQIWPDAPNTPGFPSAELHPGDRFCQISRFSFQRNDGG